MRVVQAIAEAVVALQLIQGTRQAPVGVGTEALELQRIGGALLPSEGRAAVLRSPWRLLHGTRRQRIAVVQVLVEALAALHVVDHRDEAPGNPQSLCNLLVTRLVVEQLFDEAFQPRSGRIRQLSKRCAYSPRKAGVRTTLAMGKAP